MTTLDLLATLQKGETNRVEFKQQAKALVPDM